MHNYRNANANIFDLYSGTSEIFGEKEGCTRINEMNASDLNCIPNIFLVLKIYIKSKINLYSQDSFCYCLGIPNNDFYFFNSM